MLGIEDGYFTKLLDGIEAAWKREKAEIEADALAVGGVVDAARHKPGNAAAMREALEEISSVSLGNLKEPIDGDSSNLYQDARYEGDRFVGVALPAWVAVDWYKKLKAVKEKAIAALAAPPRNCDVGTPDEQLARFNDYCNARVCISCGVPANLCRFWWAQTPYDEGGAK